MCYKLKNTLYHFLAVTQHIKTIHYIKKLDGSPCRRTRMRVEGGRKFKRMRNARPERNSMNRPKNLTKKNGVYLFKNSAEEIIYIGKAKNIAQRIATYFNNPGDIKTELLLQEATSIDTIPTGTELEALLLESQLIKLYQPKFNVLLKEGDPYLYIFFSSGKNPSMQLVKTKEKKGSYIGPFLSKKLVRSVYHFLQSTFQLKRCKTKIEQGCLEYHIGSCAGNCKKDFDTEFYNLKLLIAQQTIQSDSKKTMALSMIFKISLSSKDFKA